MRRAIIWALAQLIAPILFLIFVPQAHADAATCPVSGDLGGIRESCLKSGHQTADYIASHAHHTYRFYPACALGGQALCHTPPVCHVGGHAGLLYNIFQDDDIDPLGWQACLTNAEAAQLGVVTPAVVERAFKRLAWPTSPLVIEPPRGRTLVNFDTNFYTTNTAPTTRTVTLLGQRITIEATPVSYTYRFAADASQTTSDPGATYPDLRVTYRYPTAGTVNPAVDTTYAGRYRIGNGGWQSIPATLTVTGEPQQLQVLTATPHLVGY